MNEYNLADLRVLSEATSKNLTSAQHFVVFRQEYSEYKTRLSAGNKLAKQKKKREAKVEYEQALVHIKSARDAVVHITDKRYKEEVMLRILIVPIVLASAVATYYFFVYALPVIIIAIMICSILPDKNKKASQVKLTDVEQAIENAEREENDRKAKIYQEEYAKAEAKLRKQQERDEREAMKEYQKRSKNLNRLSPDKWTHADIEYRYKTLNPEIKLDAQISLLEDLIDKM